jgi:hypothetical protein
MYKLMKNPQGVVSAVNKTVDNIQYSIPFAQDNTDYANFKTAILEDKAQLEDSDGNLMTAEQAKQFVSTLP